MSENDGNSGNFFTGLVLGSLLGAAAYYYLKETAQGQKTAQKIKAGADQAIGNIGDLVDDLENQKDELGQKTEQIGRELDEKLKQVKKEITAEAQAGLEQINELQERGRKIAKYFTHRGRPVNSKPAKG